MSEWVQKTIGDLITLQRGIDLPEAERGAGIIPIMGSFGITGRHNKAACKGPGVTVGRSGASVGTVCYIEEDFWPLNTCLYVRDFKGNDPRFVYYFLKTFDLARLNSGSAQPSLNRNFVHPVAAAFPEPLEQITIASILSALDDKIELNRQMNETLEAMARAVFKDWFVDFGPTRAKAEGRPPYLAPDLWSLFPDRLDDEGKPEGWMIRTVGDIGDVICGKTPSTAISEYYGNDLPFITIPDMHGQIFVTKAGKKLSQKGAASQPKKMLPEKSICVSCIATPGLVILTTEPSQTNQQINSVVPMNPAEVYYWFWTLKDLGEEIRQGGSGGSVLSNLSTGRFSVLKVLSPPAELRQLYSQSVGPLFDRILSYERETTTLAATRDLLLPKLMSGEIRVQDAETALAAVA